LPYTPDITTQTQPKNSNLGAGHNTILNNKEAIAKSRNICQTTTNKTVKFYLGYGLETKLEWGLCLLFNVNDIYLCLTSLDGLIITVMLERTNALANHELAQCN
jgi:hypothetical protein